LGRHFFFSTLIKAWEDISSFQLWLLHTDLGTI
jgi:hypothetical protein